MTMIMNEGDVIDINQCLCLPKAELNTKNSTKRQLCCCLVEFLVFNSICRLKSDLPKMLNREEYYVICGWPLEKKVRYEQIRAALFQLYFLLQIFINIDFPSG